MKKEKFFIKNGKSQKVLLVGLGILGGGTSMAKFILAEGGDLTITDLNSREFLEKEIKKLKKFENIKYFLGSHVERLFDESDIVVFNPAVPYNSAWPQYCLTKNILFYNDFTLFQEYYFYHQNSKRQTKKQIWITGTRGKSTTTSFIAQLLGREVILGGNIPGQGLQSLSKKMLSKKYKYIVLETSNYQLEYPILNKQIIEPSVAVITNILIDHLNRHKTFLEYERVKKLIFAYNREVKLFLNKEETSVENIWKNKEHQNIYFISDLDKLQSSYPQFSKNQLISLAFSVEVAKYFEISELEILQRINTLSIPQMRQEVIFENSKFKIINDSTATSPDALISCIRNFPNAYFISGGTDAELDFSKLIEEIQDKKIIENNKLFLLTGSATLKLKENLNIGKEYIFDNLKTCLEAVLENIEKEQKNEQKVVIVLSPGAKSFGLFKNEYDRGEKFNNLVKKYFPKN